MTRTLSLIARNLAFTIVIPGLGGVLVPWWILAHHGHTPTPATWAAIPVITAGAALYAWCVWNFAAVGGGTPGPWDAPSRVVAVGPYRWVRNPIYIAALLVVLGEAWLFTSLALLVYAGIMAVFFHLFVTGYDVAEVPVLAVLTALTVLSWALRPASRRTARPVSSATGAGTP